ncbi:MAG: hypothetical protein Q8K32_25380 [Archangium sp.]|nr:hypothetical protein [Archangium sp.]
MRATGRISRTLQLPEEFGRHFVLEELHDDRDGLRILFRSRNNRFLWMFFENALALRSCDEGDYPLLSAMFGDAESGLVTLEDSSWAEEFFAFGSQLIPRDQFTHWAIGASNYIVEVLAVAEPRIKLVEPRVGLRNGLPRGGSWPTFEIVGDSQIEISGSATALRALIQSLTHVLETMEPSSLVTPSWGGRVG